MTNNNNGREMKVLIVAALIISIVAIGIGFAAFTETLTINGTAKVQASDWKIQFANLQNVVKKGTATVVTEPTLSDTSIKTYDVTFKTPGDSISYTFDVKNTGDYNAKLTTITIPTPTCTGKEGAATAAADATKVCDKLTYTLTYSDGTALALGDTLAKETGSRTMTLTLTYNDFTDVTLLPTEDVTISNLGITLIYSQTE